MEFGRTHLSAEDVRGKAVLEVGARDVNGSLRSFVEALGPARYMGVDIEGGPGVDEVCGAEGLAERFGRGSFDVLISTEVLEHVRDWRAAISNFKAVLRPNGVLLLTTRSAGFPYHEYPGDYWRYEADDMREIFADFAIESLESDSFEPGIFVRARKPAQYTPRNLGRIRLLSMVTGRRERRVQEVPGLRRARWLARLRYGLAVRRRPVGCVDTRGQDGAELRLGGWALARKPIAEVAVYLDGKRAAVARLRESRPDIAAAFPAYPSARESGWSASVDLAGVAAGAHEVRVEARTAGGAVGKVGAFQVRVERRFASALSRL
jgi:SAM-dependent methyltransferase